MALQKGDIVAVWKFNSDFYLSLSAVEAGNIEPGSPLVDTSTLLCQSWASVAAYLKEIEVIEERRSKLEWEYEDGEVEYL
jgi:hypothetical protein